ILKQQKEESAEEFPEIDVEAVWNAFLRAEGVDAAAARRKLALILAQIYRGISRKRLQLYPGVIQVLDRLRPAYRMALLSDAQPCYALPEMKALGLDGYFDPVIISARYGYRKPDRRLIEHTLGVMGLASDEVILVGNDMFRDIYGASRLGIKTIFVDSNQGEKHQQGVEPHYIARRFEDVPKGVEFLR
ncbi:MAG: HAD family hydrolase, partial [Deltaproteobacteria bacterium]|nr:HAD family hydrolase [Deltaproteobacteria bacterium]